MASLQQNQKETFYYVNIVWDELLGVICSLSFDSKFVWKKKEWYHHLRIILLYLFKNKNKEGETEKILGAFRFVFVQEEKV
jgi:hypothetical protein